MSLDMETLNLKSFLAFTIYGGLYSYFVAVYVRTLYKAQDDFFLFIRVPELMHMEAYLNLIIGMAVALRQV
jgi:hypothetical protein